MDEQPITDEQVQELLREAQAAPDERAREWAGIHLEAFRDECVKALVWQRTEGRAQVLCGMDPERVKEQTEARIAEARRTLHRKLTSLLAWVSGTGRAGG